MDGLLFFLPKGLKAKVKTKIAAQRDRALQKAASLRHRKNAKGGDERTANTVSVRSHRGFKQLQMPGRVR